MNRRPASNYLGICETEFPRVQLSKRETKTGIKRIGGDTDCAEIIADFIRKSRVSFMVIDSEVWSDFYVQDPVVLSRR